MKDLTTEANRNAHIQACQMQVISHLLEHPQKARTTEKISGMVTEGLRCTVIQGQNMIEMDLGPAMGGDGSAPSPGFFAKAGLVGCIGIATKMTAARLGISVRSVDVDMETDGDSLAVFELGGRNAAPLDTRIKIRIDTDEPQAVIDDLIVRVLSIDTWFLALRDAHPVTVDWVRQGA